MLLRSMLLVEELSERRSTEVLEPSMSIQNPKRSRARSSKEIMACKSVHGLIDSDLK